MLLGAPTRFQTILGAIASSRMVTQAIAAPAPILAAPNNSVSSTVRHLQPPNRHWIEIKLSSQRLIAWDVNHARWLFH